MAEEVAVTSKREPGRDRSPAAKKSRKDEYLALVTLNSETYPFECNQRHSREDCTAVTPERAKQWLRQRGLCYCFGKHRFEKAKKGRQLVPLDKLLFPPWHIQLGLASTFQTLDQS